ncbi:chain-length determining protein [Ensifer sp. Root423]|uniref:GumC family protein n=1 Tax=Ensifer sp. Root423 TaxID=1736534 RepID=UPI0007145C53|nr:tyrosine-protein kinase domain-containing protein [Ensifer sp. Root423]KQX27810.1 chain-length determining protein [Ensifer sp. Root423]
MTTFVLDDSGTGRARYRESVESAIHRDGQTMGISDARALLKRRRWLIASVIIGCTMLAAIASFTLPKSYTASSQVVLERKDVRPYATDAALTSIDRDRSAAETEMDVLQSRQFAGRIVDRLNLVKDPKFNAYALYKEKPPSTSERFLRSLESATGLVLLPTDGAKVVPGLKEQRDRAISALLSQFNVSRTGESLAVRITVVNPDPKQAEEIANTIASLYVQTSLEFKQNERIADTQRALNTGGAVAFLRQSMTQPLLITLRNEEARLQQERAELASKLGKSHPQMVDADARIAGVRTMIEDEVQRILSDLEAESLKPSARIVSMAETPNSPSFPRPGVIIPAALVGSTLLSLLLALLVEITDTRIRSGRRVAELLGAPNLGYVPKGSKQLSQGVQRPSSIADWTRFSSAEAERSVYMTCRFSDAKQSHRVLMMTSCHDNSANASTAWGVATAAAADGRSTAFLNLDSRPDIGPPQGTESSLRPIERYLRNEALLSEVVQTVSTLPGFGFIDLTPSRAGPVRSLDSNKLRDLIADLKQNGFDLIIIHAPPALTSGDANWLSPFVDGVVLMLSWGETTEQQLLDAVVQLRLNHAQLIGTVIHQVDPRIHLSHQYGGVVLTSNRVPAARNWRPTPVRKWTGNPLPPQAAFKPSPEQRQAPIDA